MKSKLLFLVGMLTLVAVLAWSQGSQWINAGHLIVGQYGDVGIRRIGAGIICVSNGGENCLGNLTLSSGTISGNGAISATVASGSGLALGSQAIPAFTCAFPVGAAASGVTTTDNIFWSFASDPASTPGYGQGLVVFPYVSTNTVSFRVCNVTSGTINPMVISLNWRVVR